MNSNEKKYYYSEIFHSIQGEGEYTGVPTAWIRFFLCNLQCNGFGQKDPTDPSTYELPFENFDVALRRTIHLSEDALFEKLVLSERGGYCFEVNALLLSALKSLGFDAKPLLGRVHLGPEPSSRSHQVSLVVLEGQEWIVDVGFGAQTPRAPIPVVFDREITTDLQTLRFVKHPLFGAMLQAKIDDNWIDLYKNIEQDI